MKTSITQISVSDDENNVLCFTIEDGAITVSADGPFWFLPGEESELIKAIKQIADAAPKS